MNPNLLNVSVKTPLKDESNYKPKIDTQEVSRLLKEGKKRSEIARLLGARPNAIDYHIAKVRNGQFIEPGAVRVKKDYNKLIDWRIYNEGLVKRGEVLIDLVPL